MKKKVLVQIQKRASNEVYTKPMQKTQTQANLLRG